MNYNIEMQSYKNKHIVQMLLFEIYLGVKMYVCNKAKKGEQL